MLLVARHSVVFVVVASLHLINSARISNDAATPDKNSICADAKRRRRRRRGHRRRRRRRRRRHRRHRRRRQRGRCRRCGPIHRRHRSRRRRRCVVRFSFTRQQQLPSSAGVRRRTISSAQSAVARQ